MSEKISHWEKERIIYTVPKELKEMYEPHEWKQYNHPLIQLKKLELEDGITALQSYVPLNEQNFKKYSEIILRTQGTIISIRNPQKSNKEIIRGKIIDFEKWCGVGRYNENGGLECITPMNTDHWWNKGFEFKIIELGPYCFDINKESSTEPTNS